MTLPDLSKHRLFRKPRFRQMLILGVSMTVFFGAMIVPVEQLTAEPTDVVRIKTLEDGLWWAMSTVSTIGYGDLVPVTTLGRLVGAVVQVLGVVVVGSLIGMLASHLNRKQNEYYWTRVFDRVNAIEKQLSEIQRQLDFVLKDKNK